MSTWRRKLVLFTWIAAGCALAPCFTFELIYRYALCDVAVKPLPKSDAPMLLQNTLWVQAGERPGAGVERVWLGNLIPTDIHAPQPAGFRVANHLALRQPIRGLTSRFFSAVWLSRHSTEPQLKSALASTAYFGRRAYGVDAASRAFFGKPPEELNLAEVATLTAQRRRPNRDPFCDERVAQRRIWLLEQMTASGLIDAKTAIAALSEPVELLPVNCK